ncbi:hypothetical protein BB561_003298 [Smittium simulii]|uniref:Uncharacterized protein n=1 Tax=Smittium simulii TaxID=133385 RepID=A0A2T9YM21_9FUNG|nr:hypothetical protein BB561_003298 [Smittium simulii]
MLKTSSNNFINNLNPADLSVPDQSSKSYNSSKLAKFGPGLLEFIQKTPIKTVKNTSDFQFLFDSDDEQHDKSKNKDLKFLKLFQDKNSAKLISKKCSLSLKLTKTPTKKIDKQFKTAKNVARRNERAPKYSKKINLKAEKIYTQNELIFKNRSKMPQKAKTQKNLESSNNFLKLQKLNIYNKKKLILLKISELKSDSLFQDKNSAKLISKKCSLSLKLTKTPTKKIDKQFKTAKNVARRNERAPKYSKKINLKAEKIYTQNELIFKNRSKMPQKAKTQKNLESSNNFLKLQKLNIYNKKKLILWNISELKLDSVRKMVKIHTKICPDSIKISKKRQQNGEYRFEITPKCANSNFFTNPEIEFFEKILKTKARFDIHKNNRQNPPKSAKKQPNLVVAVQETLLNKKSYRYRLPGYTVIESKSDHNLGGNGLLIAFKNNSGLQIFELKQHPHWMSATIVGKITDSKEIKMILINLHLPSAGIRKNEQLQHGYTSSTKIQLKSSLNLARCRVENLSGSRYNGLSMGRMLDHILYRANNNADLDALCNDTVATVTATFAEIKKFKNFVIKNA